MKNESRNPFLIRSNYKTEIPASNLYIFLSVAIPS